MVDHERIVTEKTPHAYYTVIVISLTRCFQVTSHMKPLLLCSAFLEKIRICSSSSSIHILIGNRCNIMETPIIMITDLMRTSAMC